MSKKILFVEPAQVESNVFAGQSKLPLLGPLYLGTILKQAGFDVIVYNENILMHKLTPAELTGDILCLTLLTSTALRGYEIAKQFRQLNPQSRIIIGGVHPTFMPEEALQFADQVVIGEGEQVIQKIVSGEIEDKIVYGEPVENLDEIPWPDFDLLKNSEQIKIFPLITSRGCPFDCDFCSVTQMFGRKYRTTSIERAISEFKQAKTKKIFVYDDNFSADLKRTYELMGRLIQEDLGITWSAQARTEIAKHENLVSKMRRAGCNRVYVGFESINPEALKDFHKLQTVEDIKKAIEVFHKYDIKIHGMFIFGSEKDDVALFQPTLDFCRKYQIDTVQYSALTPLPGTRTYQNLKEQDRLLHNDWSKYDGMHVVYKPKKMTALELQEGIIQTYQDFYSYLLASEDALKAVFDLGVQLVKNTRERIKTYRFDSIKYKFLGKLIVNKWLKLNKEYMEYLKTI